MNARRAVVVAGVGITTFLVVAAVVTEAASQWIEFSLFVGLPAGLLTGVAATALTHSRIGADASDGAFRVAAAVATFGYAVLWLFLVRYVVSATRSMLSIPVIAVAAVVAAVAAYAWLRR